MKTEFLEEDDIMTPFQERLYKLSENVLPKSIDRTPGGEFVIADAVYGEEEYFLNEDCLLKFDEEDGNIKSYYYSDADEEYHFGVNINDEMVDDEIKKELIKGFSEKFGWVENYEFDTDYIDDVYLAVITIDDDEEEHIIDLGRNFMLKYNEAGNRLKTLEYTKSDSDNDLFIAIYSECDDLILEKTKHLYSPKSDFDFSPEEYDLTKSDKKNNIKYRYNLLYID